MMIALISAVISRQLAREEYPTDGTTSRVDDDGNVARWGALEVWSINDPSCVDAYRSAS